jgi:NAD(P)H dehydrogenase (quinone)
MHGGASLTPKYPLATPEALKELDGLLLGAPTRYGRLPAQVSQFFDKTGGLWATGGLVGKFASTFTSTASPHGGQETTHLTTLPFFVHQGMIYVPIGYTQPYLSDLTEVHGASPYGVSTVAAADGSRQPTAGELAVARYQGEVSTLVFSDRFRC